MINPRAGAYVGIVSILIVWCTYVYKCIYQNILIYMYSKNPPRNTYVSIYLNNNTASICWSTLASLVSHGLEFYFLQSVRHPLPQGPYRPLLLNTKLELTQPQGEPTPFRSRRLPANDQLFLQSTPCQATTVKLFRPDLSARAVTGPSVLQCIATPPHRFFRSLHFCLHPAFAITLH